MITGTQSEFILAQAGPAEDRRSSTGQISAEQSAGEQRDAGGAARDRKPRSNGQPKVSPVADLLIRGLGLLGIGLSAGACLWLYRLLHAGTPSAASLGQYALATVTFLGASIGSGLLILGGHIHERVEIAERYRRR